MPQTPRSAPEGESAPAGCAPADPPAPAAPPTPAAPTGSTDPLTPSVLDEPSDDERGVGWNEPAQRDDRDDEWYLRERPPHHG